MKKTISKIKIDKLEIPIIRFLRERLKVLNLNIKTWIGFDVIFLANNCYFNKVELFFGF